MGILVFLDIVVGALLVATIAYCTMLNRKLNALRRGESELRDVLSQFASAAERAQAGVAALKKAGRETGATLTDQISEARAMRDDLAFVTERGDRMFSTLRNKLDGAKSRKTPAAPAPELPAEKKLTRSERELMAALDAVR